MIEQILEGKIVGIVQDQLSGLGLQTIGAWQPALSADIKSVEEDSVSGYLAIRMLPRSYDTPTIPTAQFNCIMTLVMRADVDVDGMGYLNVTSIVSNILQRWQDDLQSVVGDLSIEDQLDVTGFQIAGGDVSSDRQNKVWTYTQNIIIYGVVLSK